MSDSTRLLVSHGGFARLPAKYMLYSASSRFSSVSRRCRPLSILVGSATLFLPGNEEPHQRQPQLARVRHGTIVDQHVGRIRGSHDFEQIAQPGGVPGPEAGTVAERGAAAGLTKLRRVARDFEGARELGHLERR